MKIRELMPEGPVAAANLARQLRLAAAERANASPFAHRPRVVWVNERLPKRRRKPGGSGSGAA